MDDTQNTGGNASTDFANRDLGDGGGAGGGNRPVAQVAASERDPLAYRNAGPNARLRAEFMERAIIDAFFGGSIRRYDEAAGLDFNAE